MELKITTIGQLKNSPFLELQNDYVLRILNFSKSVGIKNLIIQELPISRKKSIKERKKEEAEIISKPVSYTHLTLPTICSV